MVCVENGLCILNFWVIYVKFILIVNNIWRWGCFSVYYDNVRLVLGKGDFGMKEYEGFFGVIMVDVGMEIFWVLDSNCSVEFGIFEFWLIDEEKSLYGFFLILVNLLVFKLISVCVVYWCYYCWFFY